MAEIPATRANTDRFGEKSEKAPHPQVGPLPEVHLLGEGSPGVRRIEIIASHFRLVDRIFLFLGVFLIAYVYGLDGTVRYTYQVSSLGNWKVLIPLRRKITDLNFDFSRTRRKAMDCIVCWLPLMSFAPSSLRPHRYVSSNIEKNTSTGLRNISSPRLQKLRMFLAESSLSLSRLFSILWEQSSRLSPKAWRLSAQVL